MIKFYEYALFFVILLKMLSYVAYLQKSVTTWGNINIYLNFERKVKINVKKY
jgi:hypothetical protein